MFFLIFSSILSFSFLSFFFPFADQYKELKDSSAKTRRELKEMQKAHQRLKKHALAWAKVADSYGNLNRL